MTDREAHLFEGFLRASNSYVEFGSGGSTVLAASLVRGPVISVDSSQEWLDKVREAVPQNGNLQLHYVDIGQVGEWGSPVGHSARDRWPAYSTDVWSRPGARSADCYLIDGRFRVACFCETLANAPIGSIILIHDFDRPYYQKVVPLTRRVAQIDKLSVFVKHASSLVKDARNMADEHRHDPS
jgi:hypothetical protein